MPFSESILGGFGAWHLAQGRSGCRQEVRRPGRFAQMAKNLADYRAFGDGSDDPHWRTRKAEQVNDRALTAFPPWHPSTRGRC